MNLLYSTIALLVFGVSSLFIVWNPPVPESPVLQQDESEQANEKLGVGIERAWPNLRFERPIHLCGANDGTNRVFVVEQDGVVKVFENGNDDIKSTKVFLDIRDQVSRVGNEEGLIGFAFHPDYKNNGQFFVHYSSSINDQFGTISRFEVSKDDPNRADYESEDIIMEVHQPYRNHNGGAILFGKDGYLYISLGDGGHRDDPLGAGQDLKKMLGKILRIDINSRTRDRNYKIPADNPFVDQDACPEIFALGVRNIWRFSMDRQTGDLWAGDVGQDKWDEVSIIKKGGNYGWNRFEADKDFRLDTELATETHQSPVAAYGREWGLSITGGNVYRGKRFPELNGSYFYGDYISGNLWRIKKDEDDQFESELVRRTGRSIAAFGEDDQGELFLMSFDGGIYRIIPTAEPENTFADWPTKLSETGWFTSVKDKKPSNNLVPYEVNAPFWSDEADKSRFFKLPVGKQITYQESGAWTVPVGTVIVKNFSRMNGRRMLETRIIKRTDEGWESATYVWDKTGQDATLHPEGQQFELYRRASNGKRQWVVDSWHAPSSSECASCHVDAAGYVLGLTTAQLNRNGANGENQIANWVSSGILDMPDKVDVKSLPAFCSPFDDSKPIEERARVWLDVNCAMCHRPDGPGNAKIDLRHSTPIGDTHMIGEKPAQGDLNIYEGLLVKPGQPDRSILLHRINTLGDGRMPNIGSNVIDTRAVELLKEWIKSLKP